MTVTLVLLALCAIVGFATWNGIGALRSGKFKNRNGMEVSRNENRILFRISMVLQFLPAVALLVIGGWIAYQLMAPHPG